MASSQRFQVTGQPSLADLDKCVADGVIAVVNVRPASEQETLGFSEESEVASRGLKYAHLPIGTPSDFTTDKANQLQDFLTSIGDGPVLVHCQGGNRAAGLLALRSYLLGESESPSAALEYGRALGLRPAFEEPLLAVMNAHPK